MTEKKTTKKIVLFDQWLSLLGLVIYALGFMFLSTYLFFYFCLLFIFSFNPSFISPPSRLLARAIERQTYECGPLGEVSLRPLTHLVATTNFRY